MKHTRNVRIRKKSEVIAYWLVPASPTRRLFAEIIGILARELDAPRFEPHLTICASEQSVREARNSLRQITTASIRLRVKGVHFANRFTKTLFVRFQKNHDLDQINTSLRRAAELPARALRDPHTSLLYKRMPSAAKRQLASTIRLPLREVVFDSIKAVRCVSPTKSHVDVERWRVVASKSLPG